MNYATVRRVSEGIANRGNIIAAPLTVGEPLRNLLGDEVSKHRKLTGEIVVDAHNFFLQACRHIGATKKLVAIRRFRKDTRSQKGTRIRVNHATRNGVIGEGLALRNVRGSHATGTVLKKHA